MFKDLNTVTEYRNNSAFSDLEPTLDLGYAHSGAERSH